MPEAQTTQRVLGFSPPCSYRIPEGASPETLSDFYVAQVEEAIATFQERGIGVAGILFCPDFANEGLVKPRMLPKSYISGDFVF